MAVFTKIISSFFTDGGLPAEGLSPTIRIWDLDTNIELVTDDAMTEVGGGWYKYEFTTYNPLIKYAFRAFGGASLPDSEQFSWATNESFIDDYLTDLVGAIWEEAGVDHQTTNTFGQFLNRVDALTQAIKIALLNRHTIEQQSDGTFVLTRFEDDDITPSSSAIISRQNGLENRTRAI